MSPAFPLRILAVAALSATVVHMAPAQEEGKTIPVGCIVLEIPAGNGTTRTTSLLSFPLKERVGITGAAVGRLTGVSSNSLSNSGAAWSPGALSNASTPFLIRITSGAAEGLTLLISTTTANTADTVTIGGNEVAAIDLTTLGIQTGANGDTYEILPCDTLLGIFGTPATTGIQGGNTPSTADTLMMMVTGAWRTYFYNTALGSWRMAGSNSAADHLPIPPDSAVIYSRLGNSSIELVLTGEVPSTHRRAIVPKRGTSVLARSWPTDGTLSSSGIDLIPEWRSSSDSALADQVLVLVSGVWTRYYHDGTSWRAVDGGAVADSVVIAAGAGVILARKDIGSSTGEVMTDQLPYNL